jgi:hypothetical protein
MQKTALNYGKIIKMLTVSKFVRFGLSSLVGLTIDLGLFYFLLSSKVPVFIANGLSAITAAAVLYFLSTFLAFGTRPSKVSFLLIWMTYVLGTVFFSGAIYIGSAYFNADPLVLKLASIPLSFTLNFFASKQIHKKILDF